MATNLLIVEDDPELNEQLSHLLEGHGYNVDCCLDGEQGLSAALTKGYDLIVLDVMMPRRDGFSVLKILRKSITTPVIMLSAKGAEEERVKGLSHGADDYLTKPFNSIELLLRIEALIRRSQGNNKIDNVDQLSFDNIYLNKADGISIVNGKVVELTAVQFRLLWTLMLHQGEVLSKAFLSQTVLHRVFGPHDRSVDMHLSRVRRKLIAAGGCGERLQTVHGQGYCLT